MAFSAFFQSSATPSATSKAQVTATLLPWPGESSKNQHITTDSSHQTYLLYINIQEVKHKVALHNREVKA